jgi:hypothetical protein
MGIALASHSPVSTSKSPSTGLSKLRGYAATTDDVATTRLTEFDREAAFSTFNIIATVGAITACGSGLHDIVDAC